MLVRTWFFLCVCFFAFTNQVEARKSIYVRASASYKKSKEYQLFSQFIRFRGLRLVGKKRSAKGLVCLVRHATKGICIHSQKYSQSFRRLQHIRNPEIRARTLVLYLNIFLQHQRELSLKNRRLPKSKGCRCSQHPLRKPVRPSLKLQRSSPRIRTQVQPLRSPPPHFLAPLPSQKRSKPAKVDEREEPPSFSNTNLDKQPNQTKKFKTKEHQRSFWFAVGTAGSVSFNLPTQVLPGGVVFARLGVGALSLHGGLHLHAFSLQSFRSILLLRPTFFLSWEPSFGLAFFRQPLDLEFHLGAASEFFVLEPGSNNREYSSQLEWGILAGIQATWHWAPSWSLFARAAAIGFPFADTSVPASVGITSPPSFLQLTLSVGLQYKWTFFEKK